MCGVGGGGKHCQCPFHVSFSVLLMVSQASAAYGHLVLGAHYVVLLWGQHLRLHHAWLVLVAPSAGTGVLVSRAQRLATLGLALLACMACESAIFSGHTQAVKQVCGEHWEGGLGVLGFLLFVFRLEPRCCSCWMYQP